MGQLGLVIESDQMPALSPIVGYVGTPKCRVLSMHCTLRDFLLMGRTCNQTRCLPLICLLVSVDPKQQGPFHVLSLLRLLVFLFVCLFFGGVGWQSDQMSVPSPPLGL